MTSTLDRATSFCFVLFLFQKNHGRVSQTLWPKHVTVDITQSAPTQTRFYFQESTSVTKHIRDAIRKDKLQEEYKRHSYLPDISAKARQAKQQAAAKSRYTVIAKKRAIELDGLDCVEGDESNKENEAVAADKKPEADIEEVQLENDDAKYHLYDVIQEDNSDSVVSSSRINPLRAKFFRGNINIYLHFMSFLHTNKTQVVEIPPRVRQGPAYST